MTKEVYRKLHGDAELVVYQALDGIEAITFPFTFEIRFKTSTHRFPTIPNRCLTKQSAIMRGIHRCNWLNDGTFHTRYVSAPMYNIGR